MVVRNIMLGLLALALTGCGTGYAHDVDKPPREVIAALEGLDLGAPIDDPGPGFDTATGVSPDIRLEKAADHLTWWLMAGDRVAMKLTATVEPLDGGGRTRVTTAVVRGDAPDAVIAPAFRTTDIAKGLFTTAVDYRLETMIDPPIAEARSCTELFERMRADGLADTDLHELQADARRRGCPMHEREDEAGSSDTQPDDGGPSMRSIDRREIVEPKPAD